MEKLEEEARLHIKQALPQCDLVDKIVQFAKENPPIGKGQNVGCPHPGSEYIGQTNYMSPMTDFLSGFSDNVKDYMNGFVWCKGSGTLR